MQIVRAHSRGLTDHFILEAFLLHTASAGCSCPFSAIKLNLWIPASVLRAFGKDHQRNFKIGWRPIHDEETYFAGGAVTLRNVGRGSGRRRWGCGRRWKCRRSRSWRSGHSRTSNAGTNSTGANESGRTAHWQYRPAADRDHPRYRKSKRQCDTAAKCESGDYAEHQSYGPGHYKSERYDES